MLVVRLIARSKLRASAVWLLSCQRQLLILIGNKLGIIFVLREREGRYHMEDIVSFDGSY